MIVSLNILILFILTLTVCLIGFKKYVWFISIGYGFSISAIAIGLIALFLGKISACELVYCIVMTVYGLRLGGFLCYRELKTGYNARMTGEISDGSSMPFGVKIALWITCALLYLLMMAPLIYRMENSAVTNGCEIAGLIISILGILLESAADLEKSRAKKKNPARFVDIGLFRLVRCPNYLGELILWTGVFISGFGALKGVGQWIASIIGYLGIVYVMFSGARRLEIRQDKNYGDDAGYRAYKQSTPILLPFIPLYSVKSQKWLVG